jgi:hypothetical protein
MMRSKVACAGKRALQVDAKPVANLSPLSAGCVSVQCSASANNVRSRTIKGRTVAKICRFRRSVARIDVMLSQLASFFSRLRQPFDGDDWRETQSSSMLWFDRPKCDTGSHKLDPLLNRFNAPF